MAVSMPHGKVHSPAKFRGLTGARRAPGHDPDHMLKSALEHAKHKTGLGSACGRGSYATFPV